MKKFIPKLLLLSGLAMVIASCSKKDSNSPSSAIVGKWSIASDTTRTYDSTGTLLATDVNTDIQPTDYVQFNSNGTGGEEEYGFNVTFTYTATATNLHLVYKSSDVQGGTIANPIQDVAIKHLDAHSMYTIETESDTENSVTYVTKESTHFTK
jgi:hypothetical protein